MTKTIQPELSHRSKWIVFKTAATTFLLAAMIKPSLAQHTSSVSGRSKPNTSNALKTRGAIGCNNHGLSVTGYDPPHEGTDLH